MLLVRDVWGFPFAAVQRVPPHVQALFCRTSTSGMNLAIGWQTFGGCDEGAY